MNYGPMVSFLEHLSLFHLMLIQYAVLKKVSEIEAEYFPPKEEVILQNETPTDLYILVSGVVVC